jgi:DNA-binding transcriptional LysR family regulator
VDIEQAKTFLAIISHGSFLEASRNLHLTQSTISARIQRLEQELGARLFIRNRSGAVLTAEGRRFIEYAKRLVLTAEQARHDVGLPSRYSSTIRIGGRIALWERFLPRWVGNVRQAEPDIAIRSVIGFEEDLMRHLVEGTLDIAVMYTPHHSPGLVVEYLFDERLIMVSSRKHDTGPGNDYIYVEWGPSFYAQHTQFYPDLERPPQVVNIGWLAVQLILSNGGSCFLPERMAEPLVESGRLHLVEHSPEFLHPTYMVYPRESDNPVLSSALQRLRNTVQ